MGKEGRRKEAQERTLPSESGIPSTDLVSELTLLFSCHLLEHLGERSRIPGQVVIVSIVSIPAACFSTNSGTFRRPRTGILVSHCSPLDDFPALFGVLLHFATTQKLDWENFQRQPIVGFAIGWGCLSPPPRHASHENRSWPERWRECRGYRRAGSMTMINCDDNEQDLILSIRMALIAMSMQV